MSASIVGTKTTGRVGPSVVAALVFLASASPLVAQDAPGFERRRLADDFTCEGAGFADLDRDGHGDVIAGPRWWRGPDFAEARELDEPVVFDPHGYSDSFFTFPHDLDGDGWTDVLVVGFPGKDARWYENPGAPAADGVGRWTRHDVLVGVDNESPAWTDLTGDGRPELVFHRGGRLGWAEPGDDPRAAWTFHPLSPDLGLPTFTHGLGVGDVDGDGRADVLEKTGWWRQPDDLAGDPEWERHPQAFAARGGAQMLVTDADGDGDADVVTSEDAHGWGLVWFEQTAPDEFAQHVILGDVPSANAHGLAMSELHALALVDVDGDGLDDVVTGKRHWAHGPGGAPDPGAPSLLVWFRCVRTPRGDGGADVAWVPRVIDDDSGVGTQVTAGDVDGDGRADVVVGNKQGAYVFLQRDAMADPVYGAAGAGGLGALPTGVDGATLDLGFESGTLAGWTAEGEAFAGQPVLGDAPSARGRERSRHDGAWWIGGWELHGDEPTGTLTSAPFVVTEPWLSFLVGGGSHEGTRVELVLDGATPLDEDIAPGGVAFTTSGADYESMQRVVVDVRPWQGRHLRVRLVDEATGGWGHVNFDDLRVHATEPVFERPADLPLLIPADAPRPNAGLPADEAAAAMTVPDGFRVDVIAAEPDLHQPIALHVDVAGRLWVAEAHTYPERAPEGEGRDRIVVFSDDDRDGAFETRTVFADGLNLVSGLVTGHGGVWVGAAPYLLFIPDADHDLVPDGPPEVRLDGWGHEDTHETLNAFIWGPDGWLYGCHGVFTHSRVGAPGTPDEERVPLNAGVWRYHPVRGAFEVFAWGTSNPWGLDFDAHGEAFITACVIPHLWHVVPGARYERQAGDHFGDFVQEDIGTIADHLHWQGSDPWHGNERSSSVGGGHAHCGALIYQGDAFPDAWRGALLMNNIHGNRVNLDRLERAGSGFVGRHDEDFLLANDAWFRGIALRQGPGGAVYLIDWYDERACHWTEPEVWDRSNGRLYRIAYGEHEPWTGDVRRRSDLALIAGLTEDPDGWSARSRLLVLAERAAAGTLDTDLVHRGLGDALRQAEDAPARLRALWALHVTGGLDEPLRFGLLASEDEHVRAWTIRLGAEGLPAARARDAADGDATAASGTPDPDTARAWLALAETDPSPVVRRELASALQRLAVDDPLRWDLAARLVAHGEDVDDHNLPLLCWYGLEPMVPLDGARALALARTTPLPRIERFVVRRVAAEPSLDDALARAMLADVDTARRARWLEEWDDALRRGAERAMPPSWPSLAGRIAGNGTEEERDRALLMSAAFGDVHALPALVELLRDATADTSRRLEALEGLGRMGDAAAVPALLAALDEPAFRGPALRALAGLDDPSIALQVVLRWPVYDADQVRDACNTLAARVGSARTLLAAVEDGRVPVADLSPFVIRLLHEHGDAEVDALLARTVGTVRDADEDAAALVEAYTALLTPAVLDAADPVAGRAVFTRVCAQCHTFFGEGGDVGPELTGSNRRDLDYLLTTVLDPDAVVGLDYQASVVTLSDGRVLTGLVREETEGSFLLVSENDRVVVRTADVAERRLSQVSTMPQGLLTALPDEEVADLVAYLRSDRQVPRRATPELAASFFDGATLAGWSGDPAVWSVEDGELVGRTDGLAHNSFLASDLELGDFRLTFEVRLVDDRGNSGVQFRSTVDGSGDVSGYQADIGPGWWGKLYEEHGRGLLWETSGEQHVAKDGWNRYVVEAVGHRVRTWINDQPCVDLEDPDGALRGVVALQVHSGGPTEVRFRAFEVELLEAEAAAER